MGKPLTREKYTINYDYKGGEDTRGKEYTYSDGVGCISMRMAKEVAQAMKLGDCIPSCFQTRFRGFKVRILLQYSMRQRCCLLGRRVG